jgi:transcription-repair coupling factor (superfamily II helicase)
MIVVDGNKQAEALSRSIHTFFSLLAADDRNGPQLFPLLMFCPCRTFRRTPTSASSAPSALWRLATQRVPITILPVAPPCCASSRETFYRQLALKLRVGDELPLEEVVAHLESIGYERREPVEMVGEYSVRGGILDVFSPEAPKPIRIDLFGDQVESIRRFDVESQRSVLKCRRLHPAPLTEWQKSRALLVSWGTDARGRLPGRDLPPPGEPFPGWELVAPCSGRATRRSFSLLDRPIVLWDEPEQVRRRRRTVLEAPGADRALPAYDPDSDLLSAGRNSNARPPAATDLFRGAGDRMVPGRPRGIRISPRGPAMAFHGNMQVAVAEARTLVESGSRVAFFASSTGEVERVADILNEYGIPYQLGLEQFDSTPAYLAERAYLAGSSASIYVVKGLIRHGTAFQDSKLVVFGSEDLFETSELVARASVSKSALAAFSADLIDLKPGDYVVHAEHGVAQYLGLREIAQGEAQGDYMLLEYAAGAKLYVPLTRMDLVQRWRGAGEAKPALDRMGGVTWSRTKTRIKAKMRDMADELLKLYASRKMAEGFSVSPRIATGSANSKMPSSSPRRATRLPPFPRDQARHGKPPTHGPPAVRRRGLRQDRSGHARHLQSPRRRQAGGHPGSYYSSRISALRDLQAPFPAIPRAR